MQFIHSKNKTSDNAWGISQTTRRTYYRVTEQDVGKTYPNWGGYRQPDYKIKSEDIGKTVERITEINPSHYNCWAFTDKPEDTQ